MSTVHEVIKSAFSRNKFCKTMYKKLIKERRPSQNMYLVYACYLASNGKLAESLSTLYYAVKTFSRNLSCGKLVPLISKIIDILKREYNIPSDPDIFSCPICRGLVFEPVTLYCGHSYCRNCIFCDTVQSCVVCQSTTQMRVENNVLITCITDKLYPKELQAINIRTKANKCLDNKTYQKALELYTEAHQLAPHDHLIVSNRSRTYLLLDRAEEALEDAEDVVSLRPECSKSHLRKSEALLALGREEGALVSLFVSAILEEATSDRLTYDIAKLLLVTLRRCALRNIAKHSASFDGRRAKEDKKSASDFQKCLRKRRRSLLTKTNHQLLVQDAPAVNKFLSRLALEIKEIKNSTTAFVRPLEPSEELVPDFECPLCYLCFWEPVTTPCGHTFCRSCLERSLDHAVLCPLCKSSLRDYLSENKASINIMIENAMKALVPEEFEERSAQRAFELSELAKAGKDLQHEIPIFVATIAIPSIACPLHVFEPRYRLMIRRVMEAGTKEFGMCMPSKSGENRYSDFGTMLEVRQLTPFEDGRRIVNSVGARRFKCISKGVTDGYNTAIVEYLTDDAVSEEALPDLKAFHSTVNKTARNWFDSIDADTKGRILSHYGDMPALEDSYWLLPDGPVWMWWLIAILPLDACFQMRVIQDTDLRNRLEQIYNILRVILMRQVKSD